MSNARILMISTTAAFIFSVVGLLWGIYSSSQMILFDGLYSIVSLVMSSLAILGSRFIETSDEHLFPFGKMTLQPLIVVIQAVVMTVLVVSAIGSSLIAFLSGGREIAVGSALIYGIFSFVACFFVQKLLHKYHQRSEFIRSEAAQWFMDTILSGVVIVGFLIAWFIQDTSYAFIIPYIDPTMVFIIGLYFLTVPVSLLRRNGRELLRMAPPQALADRIQAEVDQLNQQYHISISFVRMSKIADVLYLDIDLVIDEYSLLQTIQESDRYRSELHERLQQFDITPWTTVAFTTERKWAD